MATEQTKPAQIDPAVRHAVMNVIHRLAYYHPALKTTERCGRAPACWVCRDVEIMLALLDAEQREYGPPLDVTDPSWLREHATVSPS